MFLTKLVIILALLIVLSEGICKWMPKENKLPQRIKCTNGRNLRISLKIDENNWIFVKCSANESNLGVFDLLPVFNQSFNKHIIHLSLQNCPLPVHYSILESKYPSISEFEIRDTQFHDYEIKAEFFNDKANTTQVVLRRNFLRNLHKNFFGNLKQLQNINFSAQNFTQLPSDLFEQNHNLKYFALKDNKNAINLSGGLLANKINLLKVSFRGTEIKFISTKIFANSTNIKQINLSYTNLETVDR